ncbi:sensor histidine kinase [Parabacteroides sp. FAFU027]|uniref:sensor histidine kinase n=1 Tax=Parabacteroides sp. FAFU027 TaxID=2922715 RepID=UPI001FAFEDE4|nr:HAMP domain-containing sensor histidine kinase [Parabacteroides sp. FAFU027]
MRLKKVILALSLCLYMMVQAQTPTSKGDDLIKQAKARYEQKDFTSSRSLYKQAFDAFAAAGSYKQAVECGIYVSNLYHREFLYKEAFDMCRTLDQMIANAGQTQHKTLYDLFFLVTKERENMYLKLKNPVQAKVQLDRLQELANQSDNQDIHNDYLYSKMNYHYSFGQNTEGDATFSELIAKYRKQKNYDKVTACYKTLIGVATRANNAPLVARTYDKLIAWLETAKTMNAQDELSVAKRKYNESLQTIKEKDDALATKKHIIGGLITLIVILAAGLAILIVLMIRNLAVIARQKKTIRIANEHNELKSQFINNISAQMAPALDALDQSAGRITGAQHLSVQISALKSFSKHIQDLTTLENSLSETYELNDNCNVGKLCDELISGIKGELKTGVTTSLDVTALQLKTNTEQLTFLLNHLLRNAAYHTESGKITLEFKKRAAHVFQFSVTDTGPGIPAEQREEIFKPFSGIKDLTQGDGLGLPICSLIAMKLNGSLTLDPTYTKGCRFILKITA